MTCEHCITDPFFAWLAVAGFALVCAGYWIWLFRAAAAPRRPSSSSSSSPSLPRKPTPGATPR